MILIFLVYFTLMKPTLKNEREILINVAQNDESAFRKLVIYYRPELLYYIFTVTKSRERAEEVVQDVFVQIWTVRGSLPEISNFRGFLFVISRNLALNALRAGLRERLRQQKWQQTHNEEWTVHPNVVFENKSVLDEAIAQLPPQQQKVFILSRRYGKKSKEIAVEMSISVNTVKKYLQHANHSITSYLLRKGNMALIIALFWKD